jgi:tetratricopeptide (TPR) repeat protein
MDSAARNPFKGLQPYEDTDPIPLFGRKKDLVLMQDRIFSGKTTLLFANSGVGKTSFLKALLIPEIKSRYSVCYHNSWTSQEPLQALCDNVANTTAQLECASLERVGTPSAPLRALFESSPGQRWFLILDQFEEVFQNHRWQNYFERFIGELCDLITADNASARLILSMRSEFLGELSIFENRIPDLFNNYYHLKHPDRIDAAEIVEGTCAHVDVQVNHEKLEHLIRDLCRVEPFARPTPASKSDALAERPPRPFVLPGYLQLICRRIWEDEMAVASGGTFLNGYQPGEASKMLKLICMERLTAFSHEERLSISGALDLLITPYGAKIPCELRTLAAHLRQAPEKVEPLMSRLADEDPYFLRKRSGSDRSVWFELYHDMWAASLLQFQYEVQADIRRDRRENELVPFSPEAEYLLRSTISLYEHSPEELVGSLNILARLLFRQGRYVEAERLFERVLKLRRQTAGEDNLDVAGTLCYLARTVGATAMGRSREAEDLLRHALGILERQVGPDHLEVAGTLVLLTEQLQRQNRNQEAELVLERVLEIQQARLGDDNPDVIRVVERLAALLEKLGRTTEARPLFRRAMEGRAKLEAPRWRDADLGKWIARKAFEISYHRRFREVLEQIKNLLGSKLRIQPTTEETDKDRNDACVLLASEVMDGRIDFTLDMEPGSYWRLEQCWLQDVKHSKAYLLWGARGQGIDAAGSVRDYGDANRQIESRLLDAGAKATTTGFSAVRDYLNQKYLTAGQLDLAKPEAKPLIRTKATRLYQQKPGSRYENQMLAVQYIIDFYENIIPAVEKDSPSHVRRVIEALGVRSWRDRIDITVNCFEMAIAIYFLSPATVRAVLEMPELPVH